MDSNSSSIIDTTYSQDERIEKELKDMKKKTELEEDARELERREEFELFTLENTPFFELPGVCFIHFTHKHVKFSFRPCDVVKFVSHRIIFYCSLRYVRNHWTVSSDSFPANLKMSIYRLFWNNDYFTVDDGLLVDVVLKIYQKLVRWSGKQEKFRKQRRQRYLAGEDMELDSDDMELFLSDTERKRLLEKRRKIWQRMLPPDQ